MILFNFSLFIRSNREEKEKKEVFDSTKPLIYCPPVNIPNPKNTSDPQIKLSFLHKKVSMNNIFNTPNLPFNKYSEFLFNQNLLWNGIYCYSENHNERNN